MRSTIQNRLIYVFAGLALALGTGCPSAQDACKSNVAETCKRLYECTPEEGKASPQFQAVYGTSEAECVTKLTELSKCSEKKDYNDLCPEGQTNIDLGKASQCSNERNAQSCEDYLDQTKLPDACKSYCQPK